jgi:outer membrane protein TolC
MNLLKIRGTAYLSVVIVGFFNLSSIVFAQRPVEQKEDIPVLTLAILHAELLKVNPEIAAARLAWEAAQEEIPQAGALDDPEFTITQWGFSSSFQIGDADETWYGISQNMPFPGKRSLQRQVAAKGAEIAGAEFHGKIREVITRAKAAYYQAFLADKSYLIYLEHQTLLETFIKVAEKRYALGQVPQLDILNATLEMTKLHASLLVLEQERKGIRALINTLLNRPPDWPIGPIKDLTYRPLLLSLDDLTGQAIAKRPALSVARFMIDKNEQARALANKNNQPDFMIETAYMDLHAGSNAWMLSVKINLPWLLEKYDAHARHAALKEAQARADYTAIQNQTLSDVRNLFNKVKTAEALIDAYQKGILPQAEQLLAAAQIGYQTGKVNFLNLIDSQRALLDFNLEYFGVLVQFFDSIAQLEHAVGEEIKF